MKIKSFEFFQLVRLLRREQSKPVLFKQAVDFNFPATDVYEFKEESDVIIITLCFLSLCGAQGVLPDPLKTKVLEQAQKKDCALQDFLDIFHQRIITLFYEAWESRHFFVGYERVEPSSILRLLQSVLGEAQLLQQRDKKYQECLFYYSGFFCGSSSFCFWVYCHDRRLFFMAGEHHFGW
jgi:predicted component of type VI protein secretion system